MLPVIEQSMSQAFVGVDHNLNAIIVSIRGTQENRFWNNLQTCTYLFKFLGVAISWYPTSQIFWSAYRIGLRTWYGSRLNLIIQTCPMLRFVVLTIWCNFASLFNSKAWLIFPPPFFLLLMRFLLWLKVHIGFYSSYNNTVLRPAITNAVRKARKLHGHSDVIVTGHSMGGALASFCALDLAVSAAQEVTMGGHRMYFPPPWSLKRLPHLQMSFGSNSVHLMTFGQPRVGNAAFASYFAQYVPYTVRMTHERDIVPHLPPYFFFLPKLTYKHFPREVCPEQT